jgi:hypothetical protein
MRLSQPRKDDAFALLLWLKQRYGAEKPFTTSLARRLATTCCDCAFGDWRDSRFAISLEFLVAHGHLMQAEPTVYSIPRMKAKRSCAKDSLSGAIEATKDAASGHPVKIAEIIATGHAGQAIRSGIDVMSALGIVKLSRGSGGRLIRWDSEQEMAVKNIGETTKEYCCLLSENDELDKEAARLTAELRSIGWRSAPNSQPPRHFAEASLAARHEFVQVVA